MKLVAVLEKNGEYFGDAVSRCFRDADGVVVLATSRCEDIASRRCDVVVVSPEYARTTVPCPNLRCGVLLTPHGCFFTPQGAKSLVTYGMSPQSTLTLSSLGAQSSLLAIQREVTAVSGRVLEQQELPVPSAGSADTTLVTAGGRLLLGLSPQGGAYSHI